MKITPYVGLRAFSALEVAPLEHFEDKDTIRQELIGRGRLFENLRGQHYLAYSDKDAERLNERVIVDALAYHKFAVSSFEEYTDLNQTGPLTWDQSMQRLSAIHHGPEPHGCSIPSPPFYPPPPLPPSHSFTSPPPSHPIPRPPPSHPNPPPDDVTGEHVEVDLTPLTDEQCLLCVHTVKSFNIEGKKWGEF